MQQTVRVSARSPYARPGVGGFAPGFGDAICGDLTLAGPMLREGGQIAPQPGRVAMIVLGMHRSGTSAMARMLSLLGCALPATLMPARAGNEGGHWESEAICGFNDALLDSVGSHWADWRMGADWAAPGGDWLARGRQVLREEFGAAGLFVMKDPRQCRLMPFWRDVLAAEGVAARVVLTLRHPWEVAQSLARRDGIGAARAGLVWLGHMLGAEAGSRGMARSVCPYDALMAARAKQGGEAALEDLARDLGERLGVAWPSLSPRVLGEMAAFLDPAARHHVVDGAVLTGWAGRVYAILSGWTVDGENARDYAELDGIALALAQAGPDLARMLEENEALAGDVARLRGETDAARGALAGALEWLGDERRDLTQARSEGEALRQERDAARAALDAGRDDLAQARARLVDLDGALAERDAGLAMRDGVLAAREAGLLELAGVRDGLVAERVALFGRIDALEQARDAAEGWVLRLAKERHDLERVVTRGSRRIAAMEQALARGAAREDRLREAVAHVRAQALAQEQEVAALAAKERAPQPMDDGAMVEALREQAGRDLAERYGEIAALTLMLREQVEAARRREGEAAWMRGLWAAMERAPVWWNWVPGAVRRHVRDGWLARRGLFDARAYRAEHRDVAAAGMDALDHYIRHGMGEGRVSPSADARVSPSADALLPAMMEG